MKTQDMLPVVELLKSLDSFREQKREEGEDMLIDGLVRKAREVQIAHNIKY